MNVDHLLADHLTRTGFARAALATVSASSRPAEGLRSALLGGGQSEDQSVRISSVFSREKLPFFRLSSGAGREDGRPLWSGSSVTSVTRGARSVPTVTHGLD